MIFMCNVAWVCAWLMYLPPSRASHVEFFSEFKVKSMMLIMVELDD